MDESSGGNGQTASPLPGSLDRARDSDLVGRFAHPWTRRLILALMALVPCAALLNVFGQDPSAESAQGGGATLTLEAPSTLRGGLIFQTRIEIRADDGAIAKPTLVLSEGWLDSITLNALSPEPAEQEGEGHRVTWEFSPLEAGESITVWAEWQVNPNRVGTASGNLELRDGDQQLTTLDRTVRFFP